VGWGMNYRNDPSLHYCNISYAMGHGLRYGQSGSLEHSDSQCLECRIICRCGVTNPCAVG
jgi:hypothetical protein